jgi:hypothetical protein
MTKVVDYKYLASFSQEQIQWLEVLEVFCKNHTNLIPVLIENNYIGYYEIDDIMSFHKLHF